jgi:hypothetical protein
MAVRAVAAVVFGICCLLFAVCWLLAFLCCAPSGS